MGKILYANANKSMTEYVHTHVLGFESPTQSVGAIQSNIDLCDKLSLCTPIRAGLELPPAARLTIIQSRVCKQANKWEAAIQRHETWCYTYCGHGLDEQAVITYIASVRDTPNPTIGSRCHLKRYDLPLRRVFKLRMAYSSSQTRLPPQFP